ncbi:putative skeletal organic matrix protein 5 [Oculina patagonica]
MRSTLDVGFILQLFCVIAILTVAADGNNTSPGLKTTPAPAKKSDNTIIVNVDHDSHNTEKAIKSLEATLEKNFQELLRVVNATSRGNPNAPSGSSFASCKDIYVNHKSQGNRAYFLQMDYGKVPVFCHMTSHGLGACGGGGWTLVMKIDGAKATFRYDSQLWSNKIDFNLPGGKTGFDHHEAKLPTYWNTPFSKICLGMKIGQQINFIALDKQANSLYSLIADGQYRATLPGRKTWKTLIGSQASLQTNCNKEGFNALGGSGGGAKARVCFLGNQQNDCNNCNSRVEFGTGGDPDDSNTCGNAVKSGDSPDNGGKNIKAMGYILVQ